MTIASCADGESARRVAMKTTVESKASTVSGAAGSYRNRIRFKRDVMFHLGGLNLYRMKSL